MSSRALRLVALALLSPSLVLAQVPDSPASSAPPRQNTPADLAPPAAPLPDDPKSATPLIVAPPPLREPAREMTAPVPPDASAPNALPAPSAASVEPGAQPAEVAPRSPLAWWWQHTTPVPIAFYTPENQVGLGIGLMSTWLMEGAPRDRPSNVLLYGIYTTRKQTILGLSHELRFANDRYVFSQELRFIDWPDRYYGIGNATSAAAREDYTDRYWQLESELQLRVIAGLYLGVRHQLRVSETHDLDATSELATDRPLGVGRVVWSGVGPAALWDTRKGLFWPTGGSLLRADATFFRPYFGAAFDAALYRLDLRHYQPAFRDHILALRFVAYGATGASPFQLMPALGGALLFRGWFLGRLRDSVLLASELEYRVPITVRWAAVGFGSLGRVAARVDELSLRGLHGAGGAGLRFAVRPESRANFRLDVAYGDEFSVYFQFREAF